jgi:nucleoside-diphosphate-sugar epimerase
MRILVSGASGFIGRAFCQEACRRGHRILALSRDSSALCQALPDVEVAQGSLADTPWDVVSRFAPEAALHLAWIAEPGVYLNSPDNEIWLQQSKDWFQRLIELGVNYVVGTGTCIEYAPSAQPLHEDDTPLGPQFPYSKAKAALFEWMRGLADVDRAWFRIFYPYGSGEHPNRYTSVMVRQLRAGSPLAINTPNSVRDYIEVRDVASGLCIALEARVTGALNIGTGTGVTISHIARSISRLLGADERLVQEKNPPTIDPVPSLIANAAKLRQTGWRPEVGLEEGLERLITLTPFIL